MKTTYRSLTGAALLLALVPWMTGCGRADEAEDKAVKVIEKLGGGSTRDEKAKGKPIVSVGLVNSKVTDAGLKKLAGLKQLQQLQGLGLGFTKVTDRGLKELAGFKQLQGLGLNNTRVTSAGLKHLAGLKQLQKLSLDNTQVTDEGLKELAGLKNLQELDLIGTRVNRGVADLKKALPKLKIVR